MAEVPRHSRPGGGRTRGRLPSGGAHQVRRAPVSYHEPLEIWGLSHRVDRPGPGEDVRRVAGSNREDRLGRIVRDSKVFKRGLHPLRPKCAKIPDRSVPSPPLEQGPHTPGGGQHVEPEPALEQDSHDSVAGPAKPVGIPRPRHLEPRPESPTRASSRSARLTRAPAIVEERIAGTLRQVVLADGLDDLGRLTGGGRVFGADDPRRAANSLPERTISEARSALHRNAAREAVPRAAGERLARSSAVWTMRRVRSCSVPSFRARRCPSAPPPSPPARPSYRSASRNARPPAGRGGPPASRAGSRRVLAASAADHHEVRQERPVLLDREVALMGASPSPRPWRGVEVRRIEGAHDRLWPLDLLDDLLEQVRSATGDPPSGPTARRSPSLMDFRRSSGSTIIARARSVST